jgi:hypothetical protein
MQTSITRRSNGFIVDPGEEKPESVFILNGKSRSTNSSVSRSYRLEDAPASGQGLAFLLLKSAGREAL